MDQSRRVIAQSPYATNPRVEQASPLIHTIRNKLSDGSLNMPVAPKVVQDLQSIMKDPDQEMRRVVEVARKDQELALGILAMSNSAAITGLRPNRSLPDALARVGLKAAYSIAVRYVTERFRSTIKSPPLQMLAGRLWHRTCAVATAPRLIARKANQAEPEDFYALALLTKMHHALTKLRDLFQRNRGLGRQLYLNNLAQHAVDQAGSRCRRAARPGAKRRPPEAHQARGTLLSCRAEGAQRPSTRQVNIVPTRQPPGWIETHEILISRSLRWAAR